MEKIAVIGCGTMGHSIALSAAWAGFDVMMYGISDEELERAFDSIENKLHVLMANDLLTSDDLLTVRDRVTTVTTIERAVKDATFVIEAVPERLDLKQQVFKQLDSLCDPTVILASNTSAISPTDIAAETKNPERTVITHFWHPAHLIPLVEVVRGEKTSDKTVERSMALMNDLNKKPIELKKEAPGFVGNRLQFALLREAQHILEEGIASKEDIDAAVLYSIGRRLSVTGPFLSADMGGLDVFKEISNYLYKDLSTAKLSASSMDELVESGKLGSKTGEGYYEWSPDFTEEMNTAREKELIRYVKQDRGL
ncbi:3-hydroxyacyl-CoA dehydrogenase NAD-binding domain-containing protein [Sporosarcina sp. GW1-11]|uniref:3-hydroxyacyl-CoA dehydrogenase family protein n=1 Tax=Sporosarcina sp. GW1-11 TaxID=2899126 RepID=UPI00294BC33D|nr:3-hydroxyacyl-CoA dehydrogenase NAD-binding domain-containing protein [Sporosarcina sp. GW1-11]MDV6379155.1 3-hydroxyacyl-CoA dehydrogenase NAD-binding domain-containing protein [Sporosarcina sp. GW1-11]